MPAIKFNSLTSHYLQNFSSYQAIVEFSDDAQTLNIINLKPKEGILSTDLIKNEQYFKYVHSTASCKLSEVEGFHYGGTNSRFWIMRKHFNMMTHRELNRIPFYCWQCITLELKDRDIDLVIKDEWDMK